MSTPACHNDVLCYGQLYIRALWKIRAESVPFYTHFCHIWCFILIVKTVELLLNLNYSAILSKFELFVASVIVAFIVRCWSWFIVWWFFSGEMGPEFNPKMPVKSLTSQQIVRIHQLFRQAKFDDPSGDVSLWSVVFSYSVNLI